MVILLVKSMQNLCVKVFVLNEIAKFKCFCLIQKRKTSFIKSKITNIPNYKENLKRKVTYPMTIHSLTFVLFNDVI